MGKSIAERPFFFFFVDGRFSIRKKSFSRIDGKIRDHSFGILHGEGDSTVGVGKHPGNQGLLSVYTDFEDSFVAQNLQRHGAALPERIGNRRDIVALIPNVMLPQANEVLRGVKHDLIPVFRDGAALRPGMGTKENQRLSVEIGKRYLHLDQTGVGQIRRIRQRAAFGRRCDEAGLRNVPSFVAKGKGCRHKGVGSLRKYLPDFPDE